MANFSRKKVFRLSKGFTGRSNNNYGLALRKVHRALQYAYRDRKVKKRRVRRQWIHTISAAVREHGLMYSRFQYGLTRSNIQIDRKILADLAVNEPFSFKAIVDEVDKQVDLRAITQVKRTHLKARGISYEDALKQGYLRETKPTEEEIKEIEKNLIPPQAKLYGLRFPEKDAKKPADYMRISLKEEDEQYLKEQERLTLTEREQKKIPREVLQDNWEEDMSVFKNKRKP